MALGSTPSPSLQPLQRRFVRATLILGLLTLGLGGAGLYLDSPLADEAAQDSESFAAWTELLFQDLALLRLEEPADPPQNEYFTVARLTAVLFAVSAVPTILLSLFGALGAFAGRRWIGAWSYLRPQQGHAVVFGLGRAGLQLVRDLRTTDKGVRDQLGPRRRLIVLEQDANNPNVDEARRLNALVLFGDAREQAMRRRAGLHLAREVFIVCGDDTLNIDLAGDVLQDFRSKALERPRRLHSQGEHRHLQCYVHSGDPEFSDLFRAHDLFQAGEDAVDFHVFNIYEHAARQLLLDPTRGLARRYAPSESEVAHYLVFGFGEMGQSVALHMARLAHFQNGLRLRLTVIDDFGDQPEARKARQRFLDRHPGFCPDLSFKLDDPLRRDGRNHDDWTYRGARPAHRDWRIDDPEAVEYAVNAEFLDMATEVYAPELMSQLADRLLRGQQPAVRAAAVMCFDDERRNFQAALRLQEALRRLPEELAPGTPFPIYASLPDEAGLSLLLKLDPAAGEPFPMYAFGQIEQSAGYRQVVRPLIKEMAARLHVAYEEIQAAKEGAGGEETPLVDIAAVYAALPPAYKRSNEDAAAHADIKLDTAGYRRRTRRESEEAPAIVFPPDQRELLAQMEHNRWMAGRLVSGWRYGPRDDQRKRRPGFRAWEHLHDRAERTKDASQIKALVKAFYAAGEIVEPARGDAQAPRSPSSPSGATMR